METYERNAPVYLFFVVCLGGQGASGAAYAYALTQTPPEGLAVSGD